MLIAQQIELNPAPEQIRAFFRNAAAALVARNDFVFLWREEGKRLPGFRMKLKELRPALNSRKGKDRPWFSEVSQNSVKGGYLDAQDAVVRFYEGQSRRPRFKSRGRRKAFRADNGPGTIRIEGKNLILPKKAGGRVRMKEGLRWHNPEIRTCRIWEKAGRWFASVTVKTRYPEECLYPSPCRADYPQTCGEGRIGLDLGLRTFVTIAWPDSDIEEVKAPQPFKQSLNALRRAQRKVSRRKKGSRNRAKAIKQGAKRQRRMANIRKDFLHQLSHRLTKEAEVVVVENLSIKGWQQLWGRKTNDLAPAELLRQLAYKTARKGGILYKADRFFPSSQLCHACGYRHQELTLAEEKWRCPGCGGERARDGNAALNLRDCPRELLGG